MIRTIVRKAMYAAALAVLVATAACSDSVVEPRGQAASRPQASAGTVRASGLKLTPAPTDSSLVAEPQQGGYMVSVGFTTDSTEAESSEIQ
jgi:hypothetical protein